MTFAFNNRNPEWDTAQQLWILEQVTEGRTQQEIWSDLTAKESDARPEEVGRWAGSFNAFQKRCRRLTKNGIDPAINLDTGQKFDFDLGTPRGRYDYWLWLAKSTTDQKTRVQALQMIEKLSEQDTDTLQRKQEEREEMVRGGREILNDWNAFCEVVTVQLKSAVEEGYEEAVSNFLFTLLGTAIPGIYKNLFMRFAKSDLTLIPSLLAEETSEERLKRIFMEVRSLSDNEKVQLELLVDDFDKGGTSDV